MELNESIYIMLMLLAHLIRGAGTFTFEDKTKMIKFVGYLINNTNMPLLDSNTSNSSSDQTCKTNHSNTPCIN